MCGYKTHLEIGSLLISQTSQKADFGNDGEDERNLLCLARYTFFLAADQQWLLQILNFNIVLLLVILNVANFASFGLECIRGILVPIDVINSICLVVVSVV